MLYPRELKKQKAEKIILNPLWKIVINKKYPSDLDGVVKVPIQLKSKYLIFVGEDDEFTVPNISSTDLEDMLNLLQQYSLLTYSSFFSHTAFYVYLKLPRKIKAEAKIISLNQYYRAA